MISLGLPSETSSCEVNALKINKKKNTIEHGVNSILECFRNDYSTLVENLVKMLPKPTNTLLTLLLNIMNIWSQVIILNLASVSATQVWKAAGIDSLCGHFLKDGAEVLSRPISDFCNIVCRGVWSPLSKWSPLFGNHPLYRKALTPSQTTLGIYLINLFVNPFYRREVQYIVHISVIKS